MRIALGSRALIEMFLRFWEIFVLLARNFESTKNTSRVAFGCLRLLSGAPDAVTHPIRSAPEFCGLLLLVCEEM